VVRLAAARSGLTEVCVVRPGAVCGHSVTGASNPRDSTSLLLRGLVRERAICTDERTPLPRHFNLCPVDYVARAIGELGARLCARGGAAAEPGVFHLCAPARLPLEQLRGWLAQAGHELTELSADSFCRRVAAAPEDHPLFALKSVLGAPVDVPPASAGFSSVPAEPCACNAARAVPALAVGPRALTPVGLALSLRFLLADDRQ
jgi:thioester reductase-like protein